MTATYKRWEMYLIFHRNYRMEDAIW